MSWLGLLGILAGLALVIRLTGLLEPFVFFAPSRAVFATPHGIEDIEIPLDGGGSLHGWWLAAQRDSPAAGTVLFCHGNAGSLPDHLPFVDELPALGFNVLLFDYRGFGRSSSVGRVNRHSLFSDSRAALRYLAQTRGIPPSQTVLMGHSMGGVMAANLAAAEPGSAAAVAAVAPFASFPAVASDHVPVLGRALIGGGLGAQQAAERLGGTPLLLIHGDDDRIVRAHHSRLIRDAAEEAGVPTRLIELPGADHVSVFDPPHHAQRAIAEFFARSLSTPDSDG